MTWISSRSSCSKSRQDDSLFSTDNTSVLKHIFSNTRFTWLTDLTIRDPSPNFQWRYVSSANNPADDASWGMRTGLLAMMEDSWEGQNIWKVLLVTSLNSLKNHFTSQTVTQRSVTPVTQLIEYFSSWEKWHDCWSAEICFCTWVEDGKKQKQSFHDMSWSRTTWLKSNLGWMF